MMSRLLVLLLLTLPGVTTYAAPGLQVRDAWIQEAPPGATALAAYLVLTNDSAQAQTLISISSPDFAAVEIHTSQIVNGIASMSHLKDLTIPAQGRQIFAPGGAHLMLLRPKRSLRAGDAVRLQLRFSGAAALEVSAKVTAAVREPRAFKPARTRDNKQVLGIHPHPRPPVPDAVYRLHPWRRSLPPERGKGRAVFWVGAGVDSEALWANGWGGNRTWG